MRHLYFDILEVLITKNIFNFLSCFLILGVTGILVEKHFVRWDGIERFVIFI